MSRWQPGARDRLERAALELFQENGFAETTVPQIAARAGLTTRTFFRHFSDKREVLFARDSDAPERVAALVATAPAALGPPQVIAYCLETAADAVFEGRVEQLRARREVIATDEGLRERELRKLDALIDAVRAGFRQRGEDELTAVIAAEVSVAVFRIALMRWIDAADADRQRLAEVGAEVLNELRVLFGKTDG